MPPPGACNTQDILPLATGSDNLESKVEVLTHLVESLQSTVESLQASDAKKDSRIEELESTVEDLLAENAEIPALRKRISELERELCFYKNPNTPPSQQRIKPKKEVGRSKAPKKRGAPKGHRGATRPKPVPTKHERVEAKECPICGSEHVRKSEKKPVKKVRADIEPPSEPVVKEYECLNYECFDCGHQFTAVHSECPQKGQIGLNIILNIVMLTFGLRGVLRKAAEHLEYVRGFPITATTIHNVLRRVGEACKGEYERTRQLIARAPYKYIDETSFSVCGKRFWLWIFRGPDGHVLIAIRNSRGAKVVAEILGNIPHGTGVVDGWKAYNIFAQLQRCWAHLLRKVDHEKDASKKGKLLSKRIHRKFKKLKRFLDKNPPMEERLRQKKVWEKEMGELVSDFEKYEELHVPVTYIRNGLGSWHTCVAHPGMEPTNNLGEQTIRESVLWRKIIGCFRSDEGAENYQYIASLVATWRLQGKNVYGELKKLLSRELCMRAA